MLDIKFIKEHPDLIREAARKKKISFDLDPLLKAEEKRIALTGEVEKLRAKQNEVSKTIGTLAPAEREAVLAQMKTLKEELAKHDEELQKTMEEWRKLMLLVPNVPDITVPEGESDADNKEVRRHGEPTKFSFPAKSHIELMEALDMVDFERGSKVAGFRGYFLKNDGVLLANAVSQLALNHFMSKGFSPMMVPSMVRRETFLGTGYLPQGEDDLYKTQDGEYLAGTGEVATMGYYMDETIEKSQFPIKLLAYSPCFRREAGSHSKDVKGLIRVHEFFKWEQVILCEGTHEASVNLHEALTRNSEEFLELLGLPYHTVVNCGGDLGLGQVKKYDIEVWVPKEEKYRETHSSSYFHDFQTRRLNIRYRDDDGKLRFAHSLNNTAIAFPRILVSLVENFQQEDGTIKVPEALVPYMGKSVIGQ